MGGGGRELDNGERGWRLQQHRAAWPMSQPDLSQPLRTWRRARASGSPRLSAARKRRGAAQRRRSL